MLYFSPFRSYDLRMNHMYLGAGYFCFSYGFDSRRPELRA